MVEQTLSARERAQILDVNNLESLKSQAAFRDRLQTQIQEIDKHIDDKALSYIKAHIYNVQDISILDSLVSTKDAKKFEMLHMRYDDSVHNNLSDFVKDVMSTDVFESFKYFSFIRRNVIKFYKVGGKLEEKRDYDYTYQLFVDLHNRKIHIIDVISNRTAIKIEGCDAIMNIDFRAKSLNNEYAKQLNYENHNSSFIIYNIGKIILNIKTLEISTEYISKW